jgi:hypothetical protein
LFLVTFYLLFLCQSFALNQRTRACVPTVAPLVANGFLFTRPYSLIKTHPLIKGIRAQQENFTATKGATVGIQTRGGKTKTV